MRKDSSYLLLIILVAASFVLISVDRNNSAPVNRARGAVRDVVVVTAGGGGASLRKLSTVYEHYRQVLAAREDSAELEQEVRRLEKKIIHLTEEKKEYERRAGLIEVGRGVGETGTAQPLAARVVGSELSSWQRTLVIDLGTADGVAAGDAVIYGDPKDGDEAMVVGTVSGAGAHSSVVLLLTDGRSSIGGIIQDTRTHGIVKGGLNGRCLVEDISNTAEVSPGDVILTSGIGETFPAGLLVGKVAAAEKRTDGFFREIVVEPFVDISKLEGVIVLSGTGEKRVPEAGR